MEKCSLCRKNAQFTCSLCRLSLCEEHIIAHENGLNVVNNCENCKIELTSYRRVKDLERELVNIMKYKKCNKPTINQPVKPALKFKSTYAFENIEGKEK